MCAVQAPAGSPPDVWCQLPQALLQTAIRRNVGVNLATGKLRDVHELPETTAMVLQHSLSAQYEQNEKLAQLRRQVAVNRQQMGALQNDLRESRQQVADLQAGLAAVMQHLQLPAPAGQQQQQQ